MTRRGSPVTTRRLDSDGWCRHRGALEVKRDKARREASDQGRPPGRRSRFSTAEGRSTVEDGLVAREHGVSMRVSAEAVGVSSETLQ